MLLAKASFRITCCAKVTERERRVLHYTDTEKISKMDKRGILYSTSQTDLVQKKKHSVVKRA